MLNKDLFAFEYIGLERLEVQVTNWNSANTISYCRAIQEWLKFQIANKRKHTVLPIKHFDFGRNEFV